MVLSYSNRMTDILAKNYSLPKTEFLPIGSEYSEKKREYDFLLTSNKSLKICFFGTLGTVLSLLEVFKLVKLLNDDGVICTLDIYGDGEKRLQLEKLVEDKYENIFFKGVVSKSDVARTCMGYDFAYYPVEGGDAVAASLGNKFFDYLSARTPMIVYGLNSEVADIVNKYRIGLVGDSIQELSEKIASMKSYFSSSDALNSNIDKALLRFSKDQILNDLVSNLKQLENDELNSK